MLHRRLLYDDARGVSEALDETVCVGTACEGLWMISETTVDLDAPKQLIREFVLLKYVKCSNRCLGFFFLTALLSYHLARFEGITIWAFIKNGDGSRWCRTTGQEVYSPLVLAFGHENQEEWRASHLTKATIMNPNYSLPPNVALITLQELDNGGVLLRLAHLYEAGEDAEYSTITKVQLKEMFAGKLIKAIKETSLSANQGKNEMKKMSWNIEHDTGSEPAPLRGGPVDMSSLVVELGPMEIRTFIVKF